MFEFIRTHTRVLMLILVPLIIGSFVFVGVQGYTRMADAKGAKVARVAGHDITQAAWDLAHRESVEQLRRQAPQMDPRLLDTPEAKHQVLERLVVDRVIQVEADKSHFATTDDRLLRAYQTDRRFARVRNPDGSLNKILLEATLAQSGMSVAGFEAKFRDELALRQVTAGVTATSFSPLAPATAALDAMFQQREVQVERFDGKAYAGKVHPSDAEVEAYYKDPAHAAQFKSKEQVQVEYVVLDLDAIKKGLAVPEADLHAYYEANKKRYSSPEERRASHILVKAGKTDEERIAAKAKAEALLADLKKDPASFPAVAKKNSQDGVTAEHGGDTDVFMARGDTDPAYEAALFSLGKPGEVSGVVGTKEGFYILRLEAVRGGDTKAFEAVRHDIHEDLLRQLAQQRFAEATKEFSDLVYDQSDSLKPVADKFKLEILTARGVTRQADPQSAGALSSPKFVEALFSEEVLNNKRNTEAISLKNNQLAAGRVVQYSPSVLRPLAEVAPLVKETLVARQASALARNEGEARLATLRAAPATALALPVRVVSRAQAQGLPREVVDAVLKAPVTSEPAFVGVDLGEQGYVVAKVNKVLGERDPVAADIRQGQGQYARAWGDAEEKAYIDALKSRFNAKILVPASTEKTEVAADAAASK